jgi:tRNA 2-thiouridine synthesizing protein B
MLHLVFELSTEVLARLPNQSAIIFLNNAVFGLLKNSKWQNQIAEIVPCYVLRDDLTLRGIEISSLIDGITPIDYAQFVHLTIENTPIQTWI